MVTVSFKKKKQTKNANRPKGEVESGDRRLQIYTPAPGLSAADYRDLVIAWRNSVMFFFSSRRRHTRWPRDWSSDVCSSDLGAGKPEHMLNGSRRALVQTGGRQRGEIEQIEEGPVPVRSGPVAAQVDGGTVAQHGTGAVRAEGQQRRAGVAVGVVHGQVEDHPGLVRLRQVQQPGGQPPPVAVMLGHEQLVRLVQVVPAQAAVAGFGDRHRLAGERRAELED